MAMAQETKRAERRTWQAAPCLAEASIASAWLLLGWAWLVSRPSLEDDGFDALGHFVALLFGSLLAWAFLFAGLLLCVFRAPAGRRRSTEIALIAATMVASVVVPQLLP